MSLPNIFNAGIAGIVNKELGPLLFKQKLIKYSSNRDLSNPTKRNSTATEYPCKGFIDAFEDRWMSGDTIRLAKHRIVILGASLPDGIVPEPSDEIVAEGTTYTIVDNGVDRDPAGATFSCQAN